MKIARYIVGDEPRVGEVDVERRTVTDLDGAGRATRTVHSLDEVVALPAVEPGAKFLCVGLNYRDHAAEAGADLPQTPLLFSKTGNTLIADGEAIRIPPESQQVDWEGELGVVIGRSARSVSTARARTCVRGYVIVNDVSARDLQFADGQWMRGKSVDTFGPVGPYVVTADEILDPSDLTVQTTVNDVVRQAGHTADMIFPVDELVSYISRTITLEPGDLIATGTPAGVGIGQSPPTFLRDGDVVRVEIDGLGALTNPVRAR